MFPNKLHFGRLFVDFLADEGHKHMVEGHVALHGLLDMLCYVQFLQCFVPLLLRSFLLFLHHLANSAIPQFDAIIVKDVEMVRQSRVLDKLIDTLVLESIR